MTGRLVQDLHDFKPCGLRVGSEFDRHVSPTNDPKVHDQTSVRAKHPSPLIEDGSIEHEILLVLRKLPTRGLLGLVLHPTKPETDAVLAKKLRRTEERRRGNNRVGACVV